MLYFPNACRTLARPYARVDRLKLKEKLINKCLKVGVKFHFGRAKDCVHDDDGSKLACLDDLVINASVVVDATGHARKLTKMDGNHNPGYQAAYGIMAGGQARNAVPHRRIHYVRMARSPIAANGFRMSTFPRSVCNGQSFELCID